ncbi:MAG: hypothetical protein V1725_01740 [archaeon]
MEKKLTAQGPKDRKSYTITLPLEWVKRHKLDKTRTVQLDLVGSKAVISPPGQEESTLTIDGALYARSMLRILQSSYRVGIEGIRIITKDALLVEEIINIAEKNLIGLEVVEHKKDSILLKDIMRDAEESFSSVLRRIWLLIIEMAEGDSASATGLHRTAKKLMNYAQRILLRHGHTEYEKTPLYYLIIDKLDKMSDELYWLLLTKTNPGKELIQLMRTAYELFYKFNAQTYAASQPRTYELKNQLRGETINRQSMHQHNIARVLTSLYGDIFALHCKSL